jgi:Tol biopolymer transport system component
MKKVIAVITVIIILALTAVACTKSSNPTSTTVDVIVTATATPSGPTPTPGTWDDNYPSVDGNGNIYYASNNAVTGSGIYCVKSDGTGTQKIESGVAYRGLEVSEDGQFLFVRSNAATVKRIISNNGNPQSTYTLTSATDNAGTGASWVSDTAQVLYNASSGTYTGLFLQNTLGGSPVEISLNVGKLNNSIHSNPFGKYSNSDIIYQFFNNNTLRTDVVKLNDQIGNGTILTSLFSGNSYDPAWSPDATKIIFDNDADGDKDIYTMNADGTNQTKLFNSSANETYPRYIPGINKIMFISDKTGSNKLYTIDATGNTTTMKMISK